MKKALSLFIFTIFISSTAYGILRPKGYLQESECGLNVLETGFVERVCLVTAVGIPGALFLQLEYESASDQETNLYPIVDTEKTTGKGGSVTTMTVLTSAKTSASMALFATVKMSPNRHGINVIRSASKEHDSDVLPSFQADLQYQFHIEALE